MKLHFEPDLEYQRDAIEAVADVFRGQEISRTEFTVTAPSAAGPQGLLGLVESDLGIGNRLALLPEELLANVRDIQIRNGLRPSAALDSTDFTVEMETGTGKTYVFLRTAYELNRLYGFTKFVIVVPSVAIKEGVFKSIQMMKEHFGALYANTPCEAFVYDSSKPGNVRNFATSAQLQIMIVTVGAINKKDVNNLYKDSEKTGGEAPIDLIRATRPVLIVDEPQSVDGGLEGRGRAALRDLHPLCTLRYSATHVDRHHMLYRLDAIDAYEAGLVKQIEVASLVVDGGHNRPYIKLIDTQNRRGKFSARMELDVETRTGEVRREVRAVYPWDDLEQVTNRSLYANHSILNISTREGDEHVELSNLEQPLRVGEAIGDVDEDAMVRQMIRRTIIEHLNKEKHLRPQGIKVLSLFFIDRVEHYRAYSEDGVPRKGKYARIFEEEYRAAAALPRYNTLFREVDVDSDAVDVHEGYFSIDKKGGWTDTAENNQANRDSAERAYTLIMRDKERLLSFETKLKFIFSHSALREGWDNPNVFQICAIREIGTERERRQTLGRGLRLSVNQNGDRVRDPQVNRLTVIAKESYQQYADNLQKEIEKDTGIRFGIVEPHQFAIIAVVDESGNASPLGVDRSEEIWNHLRARGYVDAQGRVQDDLKRALKDGTLILPEGYDEHRDDIEAILRKHARKLDVKNANERRTIRTRQAMLHSAEFRALWDRIKYRTTYRVEFDNDKLIRDCADAIRRADPINPARVQIYTAGLKITRAGVEAVPTSASAPTPMDEGPVPLPDVLTVLQDRTQLTRRSIARILIDSGRLDDFAKNPQRFIEVAAQAIEAAKRLALVDGIRYRKLGDGEYYAQELFEEGELVGYLKNTLEAQKSVHEYVVYDSAGVERAFAEEMERSEAVKVYAKLPSWFRVPTPLGDYIPDWAVVVDVEGREQLYFVVETKGSLLEEALRVKESAKIRCGRAHFQALAKEGAAAEFVVATELNDVFRHAVQ
jgi:type III restriction enzyme